MSVQSTLCMAVGLFGLLLAGFADATVEAVELTPSSEIVALASATRYAVDPSAKATAQEQFARIDSDDFQPLPHSNATFGFVEGAYWFHTRLSNRDPDTHRRILVLSYVLLDEIDVYLRRADGSITHAASGDSRPFSARALRYRAPNFVIDLGTGEQGDLLVRARSKSSMQVPLTLYSQKAFFELARDAQLGVGIYYGMLLALLLYNLVLFVSLRDQNYLYYTLYVAGFGFVQLCLNGLAFEYLWPNSPWLANVAVPVSMSLGMLFMHQFVRVFLDLKRCMPLGNKIILGFIAFHTIMFVLSFMIDYRIAVLLGTAAVFPGATAILLVSLILVRRGDPAARILMVAWTMLLIGTAAYAMVSFGFLPKVFLTEYGMQVGSALEMILLSFALAYRFAVLRDENVRIVESARNELERRVDERTLELSTTLTELAHANDRLRESSLRDGLTGAYNRRYFDAAFEPLLEECRAAGKPFSVLVADIDHFKHINDEAGHLVGDDCLRLAASVVGQIVGQGGSVVRYGGEEFVVLLPGVDEPAMRDCAEAIRFRIADSPLTINGESLSMTISIGGATSRADQDGSAMSLLQRADAAMYSAKHDGRNRIAIA
ncbi:sensor domain-containing diguanylate cyclase [Dokdonella immobilis]|uniref:diguanylate cyclase n=1 Tax=Dokdonella immobilis TaxID=578942 RepID=A0A1I4ZI95_9GAMM|nr:diguanylate cyclase [Dokdonella immobilis]SFN49877.1 diguanylate cyclase (GGDEF) domain-containing protein [Dokdonella immobilis]